jgi:hypothetical protein
MTTKRLFIPMTKYDAAKGIAYGVAASSTLDRAGEIFDYAGSKPYFEKWSAAAVKATAGKSAGNLRSMHGAIAAGLIQSINFNDDDELIEVAAKVVDANEQKKCEEGVYTGFSMGGKYIKKWKDGEAQRYIADPYEISLVDLPCIPDATFEYVKGAQSEVRKFHIEPTGDAPKEPTNDEVVAKAHLLAAEAKKPEAWLEMIGEARKALAAPATFSNDLEPKHVLEIAVTAVDETVEKSADELGAVQQWTHPRLPGKGFEKKADLRAAIAELDATETAAKLAAPVTDALKNLTAVLDERDPAGVAKNSSDNPDFGGKDAKGKDAKKPDPKATADAKAKQKAKDEADKSKPMKSAVDVIARAKEWMAAPVAKFAERREIIKAAAEHNATAALPDGFIDDEREDVRKIAQPELQKMASLYQVSSLISLVAQLESFHTGLSGASGGSYYYGDGDRVTVVDASPELMSSIGTMCDQLGAAAATLLDEVLSAMKGEDAEKALGRGTVLADLHKIGARNSKADQSRLAKAHDLLAEINPSMCGTTEKNAGDGDLAKVIKANEEAFTKTLGDIATVLKEVGERVKRIEAQPVGGRPSSVNVVEKGSQLEGILANHDPAARTANHEAFVAMTGEFARLSAPQR